MSRVSLVDPAQSTDTVAELLAAAKAKMGRVPNMLRALGNSSAALRSYLDFTEALSTTDSLSAKHRELIALAVAQENGCDYCLAAHSAIGKMVGLSSDAIRGARLGKGLDTQDQAVVDLALAVVRTRGRVSDADLAAFRSVGFDDGAIAEVVASVAHEVLTNYFNQVSEVEIDFPAAEPIEASEAATCSTSCGGNI